MELGERKFRILEAIIDDFINTAAPVGSRTISRKTNLNLSSATIRNEMADLEELGYLDQPHTSAGRVPSVKAYRLYIDYLMRNASVTRKDTERMRHMFDSRYGEVSQVMDRTAKLLSDATLYTSIVVAPKLPDLRIRHLQLVPVTEGTALVVIVTDMGIVKDSMIRVSPDLTPDHLYAISKRITEMLQNRPIENLREGFEEIARQMRLDRESFLQWMDLVDKAVGYSPGDIVVGGTSNILQYPEYADSEKARAFLKALDTREKLFPLMDSASQMEFSIRIGNETQIAGMEDCSIVSVAYYIDDKRAGSLGVIGPTRMNYSKVVTVLECMRRTITEVLGDMHDPPHSRDKPQHDDER